MIFRTLVLEASSKKIADLHISKPNTMRNGPNLAQCRNVDKHRGFGESLWFLTGSPNKRILRNMVQNIATKKKKKYKNITHRMSMSPHI